jgi:acetyltransferase-like isoleucine patch superfamily enzyme
VATLLGPSLRLDRETLRRRRIEAQWWWAYGKQRSRAEWYLRKAKSVGKQPTVLGKPLVDATNLRIGDNFRIWSAHRQTMVTGWGRMSIGDRVFINSGSVVFSVVEVTIGNDVALANETYLMDSDSHGVEGRPVKEAPIRIGDGTWVGARAIILPGVTIGSRCLIAAGAVVSKDVPDDTLVAGNPATVVRTLVYPDGVERAWHG